MILHQWKVINVSSDRWSN